MIPRLLLTQASSSLLHANPHSGSTDSQCFILHGVFRHSVCGPLVPDVGVRLARAGYLIYAIDYEGHGCSEGLHAYIPRFDSIVEDVVEFTDGIQSK